jgi:hypothetical protein
MPRLATSLKSARSPADDELASGSEEGASLQGWARRLEWDLSGRSLTMRMRTDV